MGIFEFTIFYHAFSVMSIILKKFRKDYEISAQIWKYQLFFVIINNYIGKENRVVKTYKPPA